MKVPPYGPRPPTRHVVDAPVPTLVTVMMVPIGRYGWAHEPAGPLYQDASPLSLWATTVVGGAGIGPGGTGRRVVVVVLARWTVWTTRVTSVVPTVVAVSVTGGVAGVVDPGSAAAAKAKRSTDRVAAPSKAWSTGMTAAGAATADRRATAWRLWARTSAGTTSMLPARTSARAGRGDFRAALCCRVSTLSRSAIPEPAAALPDHRRFGENPNLIHYSSSAKRNAEAVDFHVAASISSAGTPRAAATPAPT